MSEWTIEVEKGIFGMTVVIHIDCPCSFYEEKGYPTYTMQDECLGCGKKIPDPVLVARRLIDPFP